MRWIWRRIFGAGGAQKEGCPVFRTEDYDKIEFVKNLHFDGGANYGPAVYMRDASFIYMSELPEFISWLKGVRDGKVSPVNN